MKTAAVVVDWKRPDDTVKALRSLEAMVPPADILICVENGCSADEVARVRAAGPRQTVFVELTQNLGFSGGANIGMEMALAAGAEWTLLLNNDAVVANGCLGQSLAEALRHERVAAVGPAVALLDHPDRLWFAGGEVSEWFAFTRHRSFMAPASSLPASSDTAYVSGCCILISTAAWKNVGPFRDEFFAYYEDAEWCQRARSMGWRCRYLGEVLCLHAVSGSFQRGNIGFSENVAYYLARNPLRFALETKSPTRRLTRLFGVVILWNALNGGFWLKVRSLRTFAAYLEGLLDGLRGRMGPRGKSTVRGQIGR